MTAHGRALELASADLDWELTPDERAELAGHFAGCTTCRHADAVQRAQATALRAAAYTETPVSVRAVVMEAATRGAPRNRRPTWTLLAAAALTALVGLGSVVMVGSYLAQRELGPISVDGLTDSQPTTDAAPITPPRDVDELGRLEWAAIPGAASSFEDAAISSVVSGSSGLVAVGQRSPTLETLVWVSPDGLAWEQAPQPSDVFGGGVPTHVVAGGPGFVAIGWDISVERGTLRAVWTSDDGRTWARDADPSAQFGPVDVIGVASKDGVIVVLASETVGGAPITLRSTDGVAWERAPTPDVLDPGTGGVAEGAAGFVAFGASDGAAAAWSSADGRSWSAATIASEDGTDPTAGGVIERVVTDGPGLLALGQTASGGILLMTSQDGQRWLTVPTAQVPPGHVTVAGGAGAFLAYLPPVAPDAPVAAWTSADGRVWIPLANVPTDVGSAVNEPSVTVSQAVPLEDGWVLFGYETATGRVLVWSIR